MFDNCLKVISNKFCIALLLIHLLCFGNVNLFSQSTLRYQAEELNGYESELGPIREYLDNVIINQDDIRITCGYAKQFINSNNALLKRNVKVYQSGMTLSSEEMNYDGNKKIAKSNSKVEIIDEGTYLTAKRGTYFVDEKLADFQGNVFIENDTTVMYSDKVKFYRDTDVSLAYGNANIKSKKDNVYLLGDTLENYPQKSYSIVKGNTNLIQIDTSKYASEGIIDSLIITCEVIESFRDSSQLYYFRDNVKIKRDNINAIADLAIFDKVKNEFTFYKNPVIWYDQFQLYADTIIINTIDNKLSKISAFGNAISVNKDTLFEKRFNQIAGKYIEISIDNNQISKITSEGISKSLYFLNNEGSPEGADQKSADKIEIIFKDGEAEDINWIGKPNGIYIPEQILQESIDKYNLPNLKWQEERPLMELRKVRIK